MILWNDAESFLAGEGLLAVDVPAHIKLALELVDVGLWRLEGRVGGAGGEVEAAPNNMLCRCAFGFTTALRLRSGQSGRDFGWGV